MGTKAKKALNTLAFPVPVVTGSFAPFSSGPVFPQYSFCYLCTFLVALHIPYQLQTQAGFGFQNPITAHWNCLNTTPELPCPASTSCRLTFLFELYQELLSCPYRLPISLCLTSCTSTWANLELRAGMKNQPPLLNYFTPKNILGILPRKSLNRTKPALLKPRSWSHYLTCHLLLRSWSPQFHGHCNKGWLLTFTSPASSSSFVSVRSRECLTNIRALWKPTGLLVLPFQQMLDWFKSSMRSRTWRPFLVVWRKPHLLLADQVSAAMSPMSPILVCPVTLTHRLSVGPSSMFQQSK